MKKSEGRDKCFALGTVGSCKVGLGQNLTLNWKRIQNQLYHPLYLMITSDEMLISILEMNIYLVSRRSFDFYIRVYSND